MPITTWRNLFAALAFVSIFAPAAHAETLDCSSQFLNGAAPVLINQKLAAQTRQLCFSNFALLHSGVTRTPLWAAEHLTVDRLKSAKGLTRPSNAFHAEAQLPAAERSELKDYVRSGFDRGHMAPNGDMPNEVAQQESFSLANMIPQHPCNNEVLWEGIETALRAFVLSTGDAYVVTGPAFAGANLQRLQGHVIVPTYVFKAVYVPSRNAGGAYWTPNDSSNKWEVVSLAKLQELTGVDVFPKVASAVKQTAMTLPQPGASHKCRISGNQEDKP